MIGLDSNILLRYFVRDDPAQFAKAARLIEVTLNEEQPGFISVVTIAETVWVLDRTLHYSKDIIVGIVKMMLASDMFRVQFAQGVFAAARGVEDGKGEFADLLISALATQAGCSTTLTFDHKAARLSGMTLLV